MNPELAPYEALAKEILRRVLSDEDPLDVNAWIASQVARLGGGADDSALLTWQDSFEFAEMMLVEYERVANDPEERAKILSFPWPSWRKKVQYLDPGSLIVVTAPDGQGKTIYGESIAEYWASQNRKVVFVHFELNRKLMMLRRYARHTGITADELKSGQYDQERQAVIAASREKLSAWEGQISYLHTPGWSAEKTIGELRKLHADGKCEAFVWDYLEKTAPSQRQVKMFGSNGLDREANNVELIKNFAESAEITGVMITQMNKAGKKSSVKEIDRSDMRGTGEKSDKANVVIMIKRPRVMVVRNGREEQDYSNEVDVIIDKNTMGSTGTLQQVMQPEYFRVGDKVIM